MLKKLVSIFLSLLILNGSVHLDELVKLRFLVSHYSEHIAGHPEDSVVVFLYKHYLVNQKEESQKDKKSDAQMPFKSVNTFAPHFSTFCLNSEKIELLASVFTLPHNSFSQSLKIPCIYTAIWQPPKLAIG